MNIIGIDPGFASLGFTLATLDDELGVIFTEAKCLRTSKCKEYSAAEDIFSRCETIGETLEYWTRALDVYAVCIEGMSFPRNASSATKLGASHGVLASLNATAWLPDRIYIRSPQHVRKVVTGLKKPTEAEAHQATLLGRPELRALVNPLNKGQLPHVLDAAAVIVAAEQEGFLK